ncbi:MAG: nucleoside monophosphate kinase [Candidatus Saccharibacteria bacterium]|nr:nucleoside monophosphate kinase [Candidatus Saccharibacteria bacterium]
MILMFGPAGSGKSLQGQILAARHGWTWISVGRLLRQRADKQIQETMQKGELLPAAITNNIVAERLSEESDLSKVILDGFPRKLDQAEFLINHMMEKYGQPHIETIIVLDIGRDEVLKRMAARGRADDTDDAIVKRLDIFATEGQEILDYFNDIGVRIDHVPANRTVGLIHDDIESIIESL